MKKDKQISLDWIRGMKDNKYDILKSAYDFLNRQISMFEKTVEIQSAEYHLLKELGEYTKAATVQLTRFQEGSYCLVNEWREDGKYDEQAVSDGIFFINYEGWTKRLENKQCIYMEDREYLGEDLKDAYDELKEYKIRSIFVLPVRDDDQMIGLISIHNPDAQRIKGIQEIYEVLGNWLGYRLIKNDNRLQKILSGLGGDYTAAYMINLDTDYFEVIINQETNNSAKQKKELTFTEYLHKYCDTYVIDRDRENMKRELCKESVKEHFEEADEFHFSFETTPNDIGQTCFQAHAVKEYGEDGKYAVIGFRCIDEILAREWEYQKELDHAYQMVRKQLDIITEAIPGGIKISNDDDKYSFRYVSKQYAAMLGYTTVEELMEASGGSIVGIAHPDDLEEGIAEALRQYEKGDSYEITYRMKCKDGSYKYIEDHGHKVRTEDGKVEHWNLILDKNELIEKTIELESEKKANSAKTAFLARMSHDIRTPLNGIIGLLEIGEKHKDDYNLINSNRKKAKVVADHLLSLINDILELNKLGNEEIILNEEVVDVYKMINEVKTITQVKGEAEGISIELSSKNIIHPYVKGSPLHIQQIFINIITNAIKYNKKGGKVKCSIEEIEEKNHTAGYKVVVEDNGIGMHKDFVENIFQPFTQESQDARSVYQGTGLGMSIVKNLVERMNGTIKIQSKVGIGTKVEVYLKFPIVELNKKESKIKDHKRKDLSKIRVLLAEDNELNREIAKFILEDEKMTVTEAKDGREALEIFKDSGENSFDLILMDIMMPVLDGIEATKQIRRLARKDAKTIPIFAMTANAFVEDKEKTKQAGMNEHISKPIDVSQLIDKIAKYC